MKKNSVLVIYIVVIAAVLSVNTYAKNIAGACTYTKGKLTHFNGGASGPNGYDQCNCDPEGSCWCSVTLLAVYRPSDLGTMQAHISPDQGLSTGTFEVLGSTLVFRLDKVPKLASYTINQRNPISLGEETCKALGYSSIDVQPGEYQIDGKTIKFKVKLGKRLIADSTRPRKEK
jgi:hypothetical protein